MCVRPAAAQSSTPSTEFFAGYSYLHDPGNVVLAITADDANFTLGWTAGVATPIWRAVSAVGEVGGQYKTSTTLDDDISLTYYSVLGGARAAANVGPIREFVQLLTGAVYGRASGFGEVDAATAFALQPGGGIDYPFAKRVAARLQLDYRYIHGSDGRSSAGQFRVVAAIVVH
jgi:hypothetical protein